MPCRSIRHLIPCLFLMFGGFVFTGDSQAQQAEKHLGSGGGESLPKTWPKTWDEQALAGLYLPLTDSQRTPVPVTADYYYRIPVRKIYKSYPIYAPGQEPPGYLQWLKQQEPEELKFDFAGCQTSEDWSKLGALVFEAPLNVAKTWNGADLGDPAFWKQVGLPVTREGVLPFAKYVIRTKGKIEIADGGCMLCHTRVLPDGSVIKGAQGNLPAGRFIATVLRQQAAEAKDATAWLRNMRSGLERTEAVPWLQPDPAKRMSNMSADEIAATFAALPPGVVNRLHTSLFFPSQVPDLIGIQARQYLNHTGLVRHRSIGDLMRYAALAQGLNAFDHFGDFSFAGPLPEPATLQRYSDEQLYALAQYLYSLKPPPNPNQFGALAARGQQVFKREKCASCHTPPLYTNNHLTPAEGFDPPAAHYQQFSILPLSVGTDTHSALQSRKGTGYYKVPSLKGVWYRGPFEHNGSVATLEDWFDPQRLQPDYVPTGFRGAGVTRRAVPGHRYGLKLTVGEKKALIAFLKTL